jgi:hypothetical protein
MFKQEVGEYLKKRYWVLGIGYLEIKSPLSVSPLSASPLFLLPPS